MIWFPTYKYYADLSWHCDVNSENCPCKPTSTIRLLWLNGLSASNSFASALAWYLIVSYLNGQNIEEKEEDDNKNDAEYEAEILTEASTVRDDGDTAKEWVRTTLGEDNIRMTALKRKFGRKFPRWIKVCAADISTQFGDLYDPLLEKIFASCNFQDRVCSP